MAGKVYQYQQLAEPVANPQINATLDRWYKDTERPRWDSPRLQYLYPTEPVGPIPPIPTTFFMRLGESSPAGITPTGAWWGGWTSNSTSVDLALDTLSGSSQLSVNNSNTASTLSGIAGFDSAALAAQTIRAGSWAIGFGAEVFTVAGGAAMEGYIAVMKGDGSGVRGVLVALQSVYVFPGRSNEYSMYNVLSGSSVSALAGDYIRVEVGLSYVGTGINFSLFADGATALPSSSAGSMITNAQSFITCPQMLSFLPPPLGFVLVQTLPNPTLPRPPIYYTYPFSSVGPISNIFKETAGVDKWYRETEKPRWDRPRVQYLYKNYSWGPLNVLPTLLLNWYRETECPVWDKPKLQYLAPSFSGPISPKWAEAPKVDKWYRETEKPRWDAVRNQHLYPSVLQEPVKSEPPAVVPNWFVNAAVPKWDIPRLQHLDPTFVGPVSNIFPETPKVDKWFRETEHPIWDRPRLQYLNPTFAGPVSNVYPERVTPDKWLPVFPDKVWDRPRLQYLNPTIQAGPTMYIERINADKWAPVYPDKIWDSPRLQHLDPTFSGPTSNFFPEAPVVSKWFRETEHPIWDRPRLQFLYPAASPEPTYPQAPIKAANWFVNTATPKWDVARLQHLWPTMVDPISCIFKERPQVDKWFTLTERPVWDRARLQHLNPTLFGPTSNLFPERATPDKWYPQAPTPRWDQPKLQYLDPTRQDGPVSPVFAEKLTPDQWAFTSPYMPVSAKWQHLWPTLAEAPLTIAKTIGTRMDAWYKETARPNWDRPRLQHLWPAGVSLVSPGFQDTLPLQKWYVINPDLVPAAKKLQYLFPVVSAGPLSTTYKEVTQLDKWFRETEKPRWDRPRQQALWPTMVGPTTLAFAERTKLDKWYAAPNLPQRGRPATSYLNQAAGYSFTPTFFRWQQLVEPSSQMPLPAWAKGRGYSLASLTAGQGPFLLVNYPTVVFTAADGFGLSDLISGAAQVVLQDALYLTDIVSSRGLHALLDALALQGLPVLIVLGSGAGPVAFLVTAETVRAWLGVDDTPQVRLVAADNPMAWLRLAS